MWNVKLTVGDSEIAARYDLTINGVTVIDKYLYENEF